MSLTKLPTTMITGLDTVEEAPIDGTPYERKDAAWVEAGTSGGDGVLRREGSIVNLNGLTQYEWLNLPAGITRMQFWGYDLQTDVGAYNVPTLALGSSAGYTSGAGTVFIGVNPRIDGNHLHTYYDAGPPNYDNVPLTAYVAGLVNHVHAKVDFMLGNIQGTVTDPSKTTFWVSGHSMNITGNMADGVMGLISGHATTASQLPLTKIKLSIAIGTFWGHVILLTDKSTG